MLLCSCLRYHQHNLLRALRQVNSNNFNKTSLVNETRRYFARNMKRDDKSNSYVSLNIGNTKNNATIVIRRNSSDLPPIKIKIPKNDKRSAYARLFALAKKEKWKLTGAVGLLIISSSVSMAVPFSLGKVLDIIYNNQGNAETARTQLNAVCGILVGVFVVGAICNFGRVYIMSTVGYRMTQRLRMQVFSSILKQEQGFFDKRTTGELVNRLSSDTQIVGQALSQNISDGLRSSIMVIAGSAMMFYMSYELAFVGLAIVPPVAAVAVLYGRYVRKISKEVQDTLADASQVSEEKISNIRTVRTFGQEKKEVDLYQSKIENVLTMGYKESKARALFFGMTGLSGNVIIISVLYYGGVMVSSQAITVGSLSSFLLYAAYIGVSVGGLSSFYSELNKSIGAASRLWELIDREPCIPIHGGLSPVQQPQGQIEFRGIKFAYPSRPDINVFQNLNLKLAPGRTVAVVGPSGSGKSTIAALLLRLYDPDAGEVILDDKNIKDLDPNWLRKNIGTVSQEPILFTTSIKDNILYGADNPECITDEEFLQVAKEANVEEFVTKLPDGYNTLVGERGVMLSGGQKQRVAIARALIKNPTILLLDEATSALDAQSEFLVQEALERIMKNRTVLTIAHRLSTIQNSDTIAVLDNGVIVEQGSYNELLSLANGKFKELIKHQTFNQVAAPDILDATASSSENVTVTTIVQDVPKVIPS